MKNAYTSALVVMSLGLTACASSTAHQPPPVPVAAPLSKNQRSPEGRQQEPHNIHELVKTLGIPGYLIPNDFSTWRLGQQVRFLEKLVEVSLRESSQQQKVDKAALARFAAGYISAIRSYEARQKMVDVSSR